MNTDSRLLHQTALTVSGGDAACVKGFPPSDETAVINGAFLPVDGGHRLTLG